MNDDVDHVALARSIVAKLCDWSAFELRFGLIAVHQTEGSVCCRWRVVVKADLLKGAEGLTGHQLASLSHGRAARTPLGAIRFGTPGFSQCVDHSWSRWQDSEAQITSGNGILSFMYPEPLTLGFNPISPRRHPFQKAQSDASQAVCREAVCSATHVHSDGPKAPHPVKRAPASHGSLLERECIFQSSH